MHPKNDVRDLLSSSICTVSDDRIVTIRKKIRTITLIATLSRTTTGIDEIIDWQLSRPLP